LKKLQLSVICLFCVRTVCLAADAQGSEAGKKAERIDCVACHSTRLIDSQRLSAATWGKEVDKMVGWGAVVPDRQLLIDYLASEYPNSKPVSAPANTGDGVTK
jgi:hypothetical protein